MDETAHDVALLDGLDAADIPGLPEEPAFETVEHVCVDDDGTELAFTFSVSIDGGRPVVEWTARWEDEVRSGFTDVLSTHHGAVIYDPEPTINGEATTGSKLPAGKLEVLRADLEAAERYLETVRETAVEAKRADPLELVVGEHVYKAGSEVATARILTPTKEAEAFGRSQWTAEERELMAAIEDELGTTGGFPNADDGPFADSDIGEAFTLREVVGRIGGIDGDVLEVDTKR